MNIVVDTNILISALIKDSVTRKIIVECSENLHAPRYIFDEVDHHLPSIRQKAGLSEETCESILAILARYIALVPNKMVTENISEAKRIMGHIDETDCVFLAAALAINAAVLSDDADFQRQNSVSVFTTADMIERTGIS